MLVNETKMEEWKMLSFFALLSNYNYFSVQKDDDPTFFATGIERSCGWVLKFMLVCMIWKTPFLSAVLWFITVVSASLCLMTRISNI